MSSTPQYTSPVSQLPQLEYHQIPDWSRYPNLGITPAHIPELARMAVDVGGYNPVSDDMDFGEKYWQPVQAWRALATLAEPAAIAALINALRELSDNQDYWDLVDRDLALAFVHIGAESLPALTALLADPTPTSTTHENATIIIFQIAQEHPDTRDTCIQILTAQLQQFSTNHPRLNAYLVAGLVIDFMVVESAPLIEQVYASGRVEEDVMGNWDEAQVYLGLKDRSAVPARPQTVPPKRWGTVADSIPWESPPVELSGGAFGARKVPKSKAAAKRKLQKQARQKNRAKKK